MDSIEPGEVENDKLGDGAVIAHHSGLWPGRDGNWGHCIHLLGHAHNLARVESYNYSGHSNSNNIESHLG